MAKILVESPEFLKLPDFPYTMVHCDHHGDFYILVSRVLQGHEPLVVLHAPQTTEHLILEVARTQVPAAVARLRQPDLYTPNAVGYAAFQRLTVAHGGLAGLPSSPDRAWADQGWDGDYKSLMLGGSRAIQ